MKFDALSIEELKHLETRVILELQRRRKELREVLDLLDGAVEIPAKRGPKKGTKAAPKYVGPNGEIWSGRGLTPRWLAALVEHGRDIEEFSVRLSIPSGTLPPSSRSMELEARDDSGAVDV